jgi:hypothetical protein
LKGSKNICAPAKKTGGAHKPPSAARSQPSPRVEGFALTGPSNLPDPATHAYRKDLADAVLVNRVIASHYADPLLRHIVARSPFLVEPGEGSEAIGILDVDDEIRVLDLSRGWAWGYGPDGRVGYVRLEAVGI